MRALLFLLGLCLSIPAHAHKPSDSYLNLQVSNGEITGQWDIALRDLDYAVGLDSNLNGEITWGEVRARHNDIVAYALARLRIGTNGLPCTSAPSLQQIDQHSDGAYHILNFQVRCPVAPRQLEIGYNLFFDLDPQHRGLLRLSHGDVARSATFSPTQATQQFNLLGTDSLSQFGDYFRNGVWHIWTGYDHVLFLIALLLPSVLQRHNGRWQGIHDARGAFIDTLKIVTAFTLAHSITLSLAALDVVRLPSRLVESAIAASVILAALNNIYPLFHRYRWQMAFIFGLLHGFGFAAVLTDLGLSPGALTFSLAAFNLGVEAGQLAIVCGLLPLVLWARHTSFYSRQLITTGSWSIAIIAGLWLTQRVFNLDLIWG